jgi:putative ABC transport system substrate-binding protein
MPVIGYLHSGSPSAYAHLVTAFREGLKEAGYVEGRNVAIEFRWAEGRYDQLPALAADLVGRDVSLIVTGGGDPPPLAAKSATSTIPVVFTSSSDPVKLGLVASFNRPGGNLTGVHLFTSLLGTKRLELLRQLLPANSSIAVLVNPKNPNADPAETELRARLDNQSVLCGQVPKQKSTRCLRCLATGASPRFSSTPIHFSWRGAINSFH